MSKTPQTLLKTQDQISGFYNELLKNLDMDKMTTNKQYREEFIKALEHSGMKIEDAKKQEFIKD